MVQHKRHNCTSQQIEPQDFDPLILLLSNKVTGYAYFGVRYAKTSEQNWAIQPAAALKGVKELCSLCGVAS
jgi:hypothetical protein